MKRLIVWLLALCLILGGCGTVPGETTVPETTAPTLLELAEPWEGNAALLELPLEQLGLTADLRMEQFGEKLLLWEMRYDNEWVTGIRLRVMELEHGQLLAERTVELSDWVEPQVQEGRIALCDSSSGVVTILNGKLETVSQWELEPDWGRWIMGHGSRLYVFANTTILERDLDTGTERVVLDRVSGCYSSDQTGQGAYVSYTDVDTTGHSTGFLNFETGEVERQPYRGNYETSAKQEEVWLSRLYADGRYYRLGIGGQAWDIRVEEGLLHLTGGGHILYESSDMLQLYGLDGTYLAGCETPSEGHYLGSAMDAVWSEELGGYLMVAYDEDYTRSTLLFWDLRCMAQGPDLLLSPVDLTLTPEDELEQLRDRADRIGEYYGLKIWIGSECPTEYDDFTARQLLDPERVSIQLDVLENALLAYPQGFFYQLRYDTYQQIHIHLVTDLTAKPHYGTGGSYGGFAQPRDGYYLMVISTEFAAEGTYYHEFSHIIDDYLEWDSWNREGALYSEDAWMAMNPTGFDYTWDYGVIQDFTADWDQYFVDEYAMINPTEDRARAMEYGMLGYMDWRFAEMPGVVKKLAWYASCIRDAFDTTGWPETLLWEQYL